MGTTIIMVLICIICVLFIYKNPDSKYVIHAAILLVVLTFVVFVCTVIKMIGGVI